MFYGVVLIATYLEIQRQLEQVEVALSPERRRSQILAEKLILIGVAFLANANYTVKKDWPNL